MGFILWIHPEISPNMMKHTEPCPKKSPMPPKCITPSTSYHSHLSYPHCGAVPGRSFCNREVLGVALFSAFMACKNHWASPLVPAHQVIQNSSKTPHLYCLRTEASECRLGSLRICNPKNWKSQQNQPWNIWLKFSGTKIWENNWGRFENLLNIRYWMSFSEMLNVHKENNPSQKPHNILLPDMVMWAPPGTCKPVKAMCKTQAARCQPHETPPASMPISTVLDSGKTSGRSSSTYAHPLLG